MDVYDNMCLTYDCSDPANKISFAEARQFCQSFGSTGNAADLAMFKDRQEYDSFKSYVAGTSKQIT